MDWCGYTGTFQVYVRVRGVLNTEGEVIGDDYGS